MSKAISLILLTLLPMLASAQILDQIFSKYDSFRETAIKHRRFKYTTVDSLIQPLKSVEGFDVKLEGTSVEGRNIYSVKWGNGPVNILLWSQMHGDEATATMATFDVFNYLRADEFRDFKKDMSKKVTLTFIPMLNPDGAERFRRRNAFGVDLNRDALRLQSPESKILKNKRDELQADFGFNLHDQGRNHAVGETGKQATISFLSPAFNYEKEMNGVRENSMKLISLLTKELSEYIPGHIAKYSDDFEPRAFGDNIQKWGTSLILIESGGYPGDREKQLIRRMNFIALLTSFSAIADGTYLSQAIDTYESLPFNESRFFDLLIRNVRIEKSGKDVLVDIGINQREISTNKARNYYLSGTIADIGDLSIYHGYKELDAKGYYAEPGLVGDTSMSSAEALKKKILFLRTKSNDSPKLNHLVKAKPPVMTFEIGQRANFVINKGDEVSHAVLNGFLIDLTTISKEAYGLEIK